MELLKSTADPHNVLTNQISLIDTRIQNGKLSSSLSHNTEYALRHAKKHLESMISLLDEKAPKDNTEAFKLFKAVFDTQTKELKKQATATGKKLSNIFVFCEEVFADGQEMLILVTELTVSYYGARFISRYGCKEYFAHNKVLLFYERQKEIIMEIDDLKLE